MPRAIVVIAVAMLSALLLALAGCGGATDESASESGEAPATGAGEATAMQTVETGGIPVLLDLGSDSCTACKTMAPILDELREEYEGRMDVRFIDVREDRGSAMLFGIRIIPTQIFFDEEGRELYRHQGFYSREDILARWTELGYSFDASATGA